MKKLDLNDFKASKLGKTSRFGSINNERKKTSFRSDLDPFFFGSVFLYGRIWLRSANHIFIIDINLKVFLVGHIQG